jgi:sulfur-carrier protein
MPLVEVRLFGHLRDYLPAPGDPGAMVEVPDGCTFQELLDRLKIPPADPKILLLNGVHVDRQAILGEGDRVSVFPPIAGG